LTGYPFSTEMKDRFKAAEAMARAHKRGLWSLPRKVEMTSGRADKKAG
jgi:hypothetical protein